MPSLATDLLGVVGGLPPPLLPRVPLCDTASVDVLRASCCRSLLCLITGAPIWTPFNRKDAGTDEKPARAKVSASIVWTVPHLIFHSCFYVCPEGFVFLRSMRNLSGCRARRRCAPLDLSFTPRAVSHFAASPAFSAATHSFC